jgi:hypothetical protein
MSCGGHGIFAMSFDFTKNLWEPTHVIVGIFCVVLLLLGNNKSKAFFLVLLMLWDFTFDI